jgi:hypothetical protein
MPAPWVTREAQRGMARRHQPPSMRTSQVRRSRECALSPPPFPPPHPVPTHLVGALGLHAQAADELAAHARQRGELAPHQPRDALARDEHVAVAQHDGHREAVPCQTASVGGGAQGQHTHAYIHGHTHTHTHTQQQQQQQQQTVWSAGGAGRTRDGQERSGWCRGLRMQQQQPTRPGHPTPARPAPTHGCRSRAASWCPHCSPSPAGP